MSSSSEAGRELEEEEVKEKRKKEKIKLEKPKTTNEIAQPIPPPPSNIPTVSPRLPALRREQIIQEFIGGKEDPEYEVKKLSNGQYRVTKRREFYTPSAKVEKVTRAPPPPKKEEPKEDNKEDLQLTWVNMLNERDESLKNELSKLHKKYRKLAKRYERNVPLMPPPPNVTFCSSVPVPKPVARMPRYKVEKKMDIRDF